MRITLLALVFAGVVAAVCAAQNLDYADAPKTFLGYQVGAGLNDVVDALKQAKTPYTEKALAVPSNAQQIVIPNQTMGQFTKVLATLSFSDGHLYQVSASLAFAPTAWKDLVAEYSAKLGAAKSYDGGFTYYWFYFQKDHTSGQVPDFAVVLNGDSLTDNKITVSFVDNTMKLAKPAVPVVTTP